MLQCTKYPIKYKNNQCVNGKIIVGSDLRLNGGRSYCGAKDLDRCMEKQKWRFGCCFVALMRQSAPAKSQ